MLQPSLEPPRRTGHLWRRESPSLLSTAREGTAARRAGLLRVPRRCAPSARALHPPSGDIRRRRRRRSSGGPNKALGAKLLKPPLLLTRKKKENIVTYNKKK